MRAIKISFCDRLTSLGFYKQWIVNSIQSTCEPPDKMELSIHQNEKTKIQLILRVETANENDLSLTGVREAFGTTTRRNGRSSRKHSHPLNLVRKDVARRGDWHGSIKGRQVVEWDQTVLFAGLRPHASVLADFRFRSVAFCILSRRRRRRYLGSSFVLLFVCGWYQYILNCSVNVCLVALLCVCLPHPSVMRCLYCTGVQIGLIVRISTFSIILLEGGELSRSVYKSPVCAVAAKNSLIVG